MATYTKFQPFVEALAHGEHDFSSHQLAVALSNTAPTAASDDHLDDITEISYTNLSGSNPRNITTSASAQSGGTYALELADLTLTASGAVGPFQYVIIYNDDHASDALIGYYDYGSAVELDSGDTFKIDFSATGLFTLA